MVLTKTTGTVTLQPNQFMVMIDESDTNPAHYATYIQRDQSNADANNLRIVLNLGGIGSSEIYIDKTVRLQQLNNGNKVYLPFVPTDVYQIQVRNEDSTPFVINWELYKQT